MKITKWSPLGDMMMNNFFDRSMHGHDSCTWAPAVDIYETAEKIVLTAELPGIHQDDIDLTIQENILTLRGDRKFERDVKQENFHVVERSYGNFCRRFTMPCEVDGTAVTASFKDGVLTVVVPKVSTVKKINVKLET